MSPVFVFVGGWMGETVRVQHQGFILTVTRPPCRSLMRRVGSQEELLIWGRGGKALEDLGEGPLSLPCPYLLGISVCSPCVKNRQ